MVRPIGKRGMQRAGSSLARDQRGSIYVEYVIVVAFAGLVVILGLLAVGPRTVENYSNQRKALHEHHP